MCRALLMLAGLALALGLVPATGFARASGLACDTRAYSDGAIAAGSTVFSSAAASFAVADIGKALELRGAAADGLTLDASIVSVIDRHRVDLSAAAARTVRGAIFYYGRDDAAAFARAVAAAENETSTVGGAVLVLPPGLCLIGPITITGQISLRGTTIDATELALKGGSAAPAITIRPAGAGPAAGSPNGVIALADLGITSVDGKDGVHRKAHGIAIADGTWRPSVRLYRIKVHEMPGDGAYDHTASQTLASDLTIYDSAFYNNGGTAGFDCEGGQDITTFNTSFAVNVGYGAVFSGCGNVTETAPEIYGNNGAAGLLIYGGAIYRQFGGSIDRNAKNGVAVERLTPASLILFDGAYLGLNSAGAANADADLDAQSGTGTITCVACVFAPPHAKGGTARYNVAFGRGRITLHALSTIWQAGTLRTPGVTNNAQRVREWP